MNIYTTDTHVNIINIFSDKYMRYFTAKGTDGRQLIFWVVKLTFVIQIFKKSVII